MPHETVLCDEIFFCENPKMAAGMALFRSDYMKYFTVKIQNGSGDGLFSIGFDEIFHGESPILPVARALFRSGMMELLRYNPKNANRNGWFSIGFDEKIR